MGNLSLSSVSVGSNPDAGSQPPKLIASIEVLNNKNLTEGFKKFAYGFASEENLKISLDCFKKAQSEANPQEQQRLRALASYFAGMACEKLHDIAGAIDFFRTAFEQDNYAPAAIRLGIMYKQGNGVPQSEQNANLWIDQGLRKIQSQTADGKVKDAEEILVTAECHHFGYFVPQNLNAAADNYKKSAEKGHAHAQFTFAQVFIDDPSQADAKRFWMFQAAQQGYLPAEHWNKLNPVTNLI